MRRRCDTFVFSLVGKHAAAWWWNSPNYAFDGDTPEEMFDKDPQRVYNYLMGYIDGYG